MPRWCQRARLESGLKLDINRLARRGFIRFGAATGPVGITWTDSYTGGEIAFGIITADMSDFYRGWVRIRIGQIDQQITLVPLPRHFGGRQWFFICPYVGRRATVLWMPPGARSFASRQRWGRQVAYSSQFLTPIDRVHSGKAKINRRLCRVGGYDPDDWEIPPKPKWMRWRTYERAVEKFDRYEAALGWGIYRTASKLAGLR